MARLQSTLNFHLGGEKIAQGARFAALYGDVDGLLGRQASCAVTGVEWKETFRNPVVEIKLPRGFVGS